VQKCFETKSVEKNEPLIHDKYLVCTSPGLFTSLSKRQKVHNKYYTKVTVQTFL